MSDPKDVANDLTRTIIRDARDLKRTFINEMASAVEESKNQIVSDLHQAVLDTTRDQINDASNYLRGHTARHIVSDLGRLARRQPALFVAAAFGLGFWAVRFFKSSGQPRPYTEEPPGVRRESSGMEVGYART